MHSKCNFLQFSATETFPIFVIHFQGINWTCVRYILGEIQYGGRVTDDYDKRLLNTFCKLWFRDEMFTSTFAFHNNYVIPHYSKQQEFLDYINGLPPYDSPEVFGLHPNADIR